VSDCCSTPIQQFFSYIMARTSKMSWIYIVLSHWNNSPRVDMSLHSDTLFWFRANQSLLFLLNTAWLAEKQHIPILKSLVWPDWGSNPRSTTLEASTLTITPLMWLCFISDLFRCNFVSPPNICWLGGNQIEDNSLRSPS
jgi:hypothetical protein